MWRRTTFEEEPCFYSPLRWARTCDAEGGTEPAHIREWFEYLELFFYLARFAIVALLPIVISSAGATALVASALILMGLSLSAAARIHRRRHPLSMREVFGCKLTQEHVALIRSWSLLCRDVHPPVRDTGSEARRVSRKIVVRGLIC